jgi:adenosylcobinamide kinase/adenosylcobinamide-phosphate guanylyltransferase
LKKILITGGQASGKSSLAVKLADDIKGKRIFIATARYLDGELNKKIETHKKERGSRYDTLEEPTELHEALKKAIQMKADVIVIDCITMWISNLLIEKEESEIESYVNNYLSVINSAERNEFPETLITVTNECGLGVIPANELSRKYVKYLGQTNKKIAAAYDDVYLTCCGLEMRIK